LVWFGLTNYYICFVIFFFFFFFLSSSLVARAPHLKCGEVGCPRFEPRPLHIIYNIPTNWAKFTGIFCYSFLLIIYRTRCIWNLCFGLSPWLGFQNIVLWWPSWLKHISFTVYKKKIMTCYIFKVHKRLMYPLEKKIKK